MIWSIHTRNRGPDDWNNTLPKAIPTGKHTVPYCGLTAVQRGDSAHKYCFVSERVCAGPSGQRPRLVQGDDLYQRQSSFPATALGRRRCHDTLRIARQKLIRIAIP